jgi:hypothetical protein
MLSANDWARTISISDKQVGPRAELKLSAFERDILVQSGRESIRGIDLKKNNP